uniref:Uncharacterized protein n=1 Tax=Echinococcus canadensis TaxID=519352 RepID=A0A915F093_9CEST
MPCIEEGSAAFAKVIHLKWTKEATYRFFWPHLPILQEFLEPTPHGLLVPQWSENGHMDLQKFKTESSKKNSNCFTIVSNGVETTRLLNKSKINNCSLLFPTCTIHILLRSFVGDIKRNPHLFVLQVRHNREILGKNFSGDIYITFTVLPSVKCPIYYVTLKLQKMKNSYQIISHESGGDT